MRPFAQDLVLSIWSHPEIWKLIEVIYYYTKRWNLTMISDTEGTSCPTTHVIFHSSCELALWWIFAGELFALLALLMCPDSPQIWFHSRTCFAFCQESAAGTLFWWDSTLLCLSLCQLLLWKEFLFKACSFLAFRQWSSHRLSVIAPPWVSPLRTQKS